MTKLGQTQFVYVTYIRTTAEKLWQALTTSDFVPQYWLGVRAEADWKVGGAWKLILPDGRVGDTGEILEFVPGKRLCIRWRNEFVSELKAEGWTNCLMEIEPVDGAVKLTVTHKIDREESKFIGAVSHGWPQILSNLKSLLENGSAVLSQRGAREGDGH